LRPFFATKERLNLAERGGDGFSGSTSLFRKREVEIIDRFSNSVKIANAMTILGEKVFYNYLELPEKTEPQEELDFIITWETSFDVTGKGSNAGIPHDDLNTLFHQRVMNLLEEKGGCCVHVRHEKITHSVNYAHGTHVITGQYEITIYRPVE